MNYRDLPQVYKKILDRDNILDMYEACVSEFAFVDEPGFNLSDDEFAYPFVYSLIGDQIHTVLNAIDIDGPDDYSIDGNISYSSDGEYKLDIQLTGSFSFCVYGCEKYGSKALNKIVKALTNAKFNGFKLSEIYKDYSYEENSDIIYIQGDFEFDEYTVDVATPSLIEYRLYVELAQFYAEATVYAPYIFKDDYSGLTNYLKDNNPEFLMSFITLKDVEVNEYKDEISYNVRFIFNNNSDCIVGYDFYDYLDYPDSPENINGKENAIKKAQEFVLEDISVTYRP